MKNRKLFLGINLGIDPSVAIVESGKIIAFSEEERHIRIKHAPNIYPKEALKFCLNESNCSIKDISKFAVNWNLTGYNDGEIKKFYEGLRGKYNVDQATIDWQDRNLKKRSWKEFKKFHKTELTRIFGEIELPEIIDFPHHYTHAYHSYIESGFSEAIAISIDGSGDQHCTTLWHCKNEKLINIKKINMPNSLGWLYSAITEYLGYQAYDGEYKVMGLAAFGKPDKNIKKLLEKVCFTASDGIEYIIDPKYIHYGEHSFSSRFTDELVKLFGNLPRRSGEPISDWHRNLAFELQALLEKTVIRLVRWSIKETGVSKICIGGGVGLNVKLNSKIYQMQEVSDVFAHPLCNDAGAVAGAALLACHLETGIRAERLTNLALGFKEEPENIESLLNTAKIKFRKSSNITEEVSGYLANGMIVAWFQGKMEAGPRALGQRSILANPTKIIYRDKVNMIVKMREEWRPFCPSVLEEYADDYFKNTTYAPFMIIAFDAKEKLINDAPAVVHIDGTSRVQLVNKNTTPLYYKLIDSFYKKTNVPVLLNTSFNLKGEPVVCTARDALRTFWSSALDVLVINDFIITKPQLELD